MGFWQSLHSGGVVSTLSRCGRLSDYATVVGASGHAVGETTTAVQAFIEADSTFARGGFLVPLRNGELFSWCLARGSASPSRRRS
jgi:hypothetical protein